MSRLIASTLLVLLPLLLVARMSPAQANRAGVGAWNREAAAKYLDQRMDIWFEKGREAANRCRADDLCLVSHGDPVRARAACPEAGDARQRTDAARGQARRRNLAPRSSVRPKQLLYEADEGQSNGTEAVLYALILASADAAQRSSCSRATRHVAPLSACGKRSAPTAPGTGSMSAWSPSRASIRRTWAPRSRRSLSVWRPPQSTGPEARGVARLQAYLRENHASQNLHNRIWGLLASTSLPRLLSPSEVEALVGELQRRAGKRWRLVAEWIGRVAVEQDRRTISVAGTTGSGARRAVRRLCDRSDRLHAQASRCFGRARNDKERPAMAQQLTSCPFASAIRNGSPGAPTLSITTASTAVPEANPGGGCSCLTPPRRLRRWDCSRRNEQVEAPPGPRTSQV